MNIEKRIFVTHGAQAKPIIFDSSLELNQIIQLCLQKFSVPSFKTNKFSLFLIKEKFSYIIENTKELQNNDELVLKESEEIGKPPSDEKPKKKVVVMKKGQF